MSGVIDLCSDDDKIVPAVDVTAGVPQHNNIAVNHRRNGNRPQLQSGSEAKPGADGLTLHPVLGPKDTSHKDKRVCELQTELAEVGNLLCEYEALLADTQARHKALEDELNKRVRVLREEADAAYDWLAPMPWDSHLWHELESVFHIKEFRPLQREALNATVLRRDVFAILPTGAGKSLIYQLAAVVDAGLTVVIAPLISLSQDQQMQLRKLGIRAEALDSTTPKDVSAKIYHQILPSLGHIPHSKDPRKPHNLYARDRHLKSKRKRKRKRQRLEGIVDNDSDDELDNTVNGKMTAGDPKGWVRDDMETAILFVTPEQIVKSKKLMNRLESLYESGHLSRVCVDEAHCCSFWGHDFRADYRKLGIIRRQCPDVPILALSATCSPTTTADVAKTLEMRECVTFRGSIDRPNLFYEVQFKPDSEDQLLGEICRMLNSSLQGQVGIIYVLSRKESETYSGQLTSMGIPAGCYHGDMGRGERATVHRQWGDGRLTVVVATIAFGLGINNPHTRFVIHATMSTSLEGYYQESGRCGRDGKNGKCILFTRPKDFTRLSAFVADKGNDRVRMFYDMYRYATGRRMAAVTKCAKASRELCRRAILADAFNEEPPPRVFERDNTCNDKMTNLVGDCCDVCRVRAMSSNGEVEEVATECSSDSDSASKLVQVDVTALAASATRMIIWMAESKPDEKVTMLTLAQNWAIKGVKAGKMRGEEPMIDKNISIDTRLEILIELVFAGGLAELFRHSSYAVNAYIVPGEEAEFYAFDDGARVMLTASKVAAWELSNFAGCGIIAEDAEQGKDEDAVEVVDEKQKPQEEGGGGGVKEEVANEDVDEKVDEAGDGAAVTGNDSNEGAGIGDAAAKGSETSPASKRQKTD